MGVKHLLLSVSALLCLLLLTACGEERLVMEGWYLQAENGARFIVTDDGEPFRVSDQSKGGDLFEGLTSGGRVRITHGGVAECDPPRTGAYSCKLLEEGTPEDIPAETLAALEELGYPFDLHTHAPAAEPLTVEDPVSGYCGNTVTTVHLDGQEYSLWGSDSVTLTDILINLAYDPDQVCRCMTEFTVDTEFGTGCGVNLAESFARCEAGQAALTAAQTETIRDILDRNCG